MLTEETTLVIWQSQILALGNETYAAALKQNKLDQVARVKQMDAEVNGRGCLMFDAASFIEESAQKMKDDIDDIAIIACSGGVDSTVAAVIANKA